MKTFAQYLENSNNTLSRISGSIQRTKEMVEGIMSNLTELEGQQPPHSILRMKQIIPVWQSMKVALDALMEAEKSFSVVEKGWADHPNDPNFSRPDPQDGFKNY